MRYVTARAFFLTLIYVALTAPAFAQAGGATAEIKGKISDPTGAVVVGATITATDAAKGVARTAASDERGEYRLLSLPPGIYQLKVEAKWFTAQVQSGVEVTVGQTLDTDIALRVGVASETITVTTEAPVIETEKTQQSNTINELAIRNLPIDRRDYLTFTLLAPGVAGSKAVVATTDLREAQTPQS